MEIGGICRSHSLPERGYQQGEANQTGKAVAVPVGQIQTLVGETEAARQTFARLKKLDTPKDMLQQAIAYQAALTSDSDSLFHALKSGLVVTGTRAHTTTPAGISLPTR